MPNTKKEKKPDFIGIGAQKAATSWIYECLLEHPEICGPEEKELHFFNRDEEYNKGIGRYLELFSHCSQDQVVGEYSTSYLSNPQSPERISEHFPEVKLIVCLRDPIERTLSALDHFYSKGRIKKSQSLEEIIERFPQIIEHGKYGTHLEEYLKHFRRSQILILFYEDIKKDPLAFIQDIYKFLEVKDDFKPESVSLKYNTSSLRSSGAFRFINRVYLRLRNYRAGRAFIRILQLLGLRAYKINKLLGAGQKRNWQLSREDRRYLWQIFKPEIEKLEKILKTDLSQWRDKNNNL